MLPPDPFIQFGVAGLMGTLWVWERSHSRKRERQLSETHERIIGQQRELSALIHLVRQNTRALIHFERGQQRIGDILEAINHEMRRSKAAM